MLLHPTPRHLDRLLLVSLLLGTFGACGGIITTMRANSTDAITPQAVHQAWVQATREGNVTAAQALATEQLKPYLPGSFQPPGTPEGGALQDVQIQEASVQGQVGSGLSVWRFAKQTHCYRTELVQLDGMWKVANWGQAPTCPTGTTP